MKTWISLLRGINVGGKNVLPMKDLRAILADLGYQAVQTYIQSGNCVFQSSLTEPKAISTQIAEAIDQQFGFQPDVMTLSKSDLEEAIQANPFAEKADDPKGVHFFFLSQPAVEVDVGALEELCKPSERFELTEKVFYLHAPEGIGRSKLAAQAERKLGVSATARNLRTVLKIMELAS